MMKIWWARRWQLTNGTRILDTKISGVNEHIDEGMWYTVRARGVEISYGNDRVVGEVVCRMFKNFENLGGCGWLIR